MLILKHAQSGMALVLVVITLYSDITGQDHINCPRKMINN